MTTMPDVTALQVLSLQPGDVLVARCNDRRLSQAEAEQVRDRIRMHIPEDVPLLVLDRSWDLRVFREASST